MTIPGVLFTAFEPSGDELAARMVSALRSLAPDLPIWALAGPKAQAAGAQLIECSTDRPVMLAGAVTQAITHHRRLSRLRQWLSEHPLRALVPVDSPAANWSICQLVRRMQPNARIVHLAAPQLWAWAPWRIRKLRRLTDHLLCLLPFEPSWFHARGVPATFVGHPLFEAPVTDVSPLERVDHLAILPGSRESEIRANWPTQLAVLDRLRQRHPQLQIRVALTDERSAALIRGLTNSQELSHRGIELCLGQTPSVLRWSQLVLVVSGTATLEVLAHRRPMVALYNVRSWAWHLIGRWLIQTRTFTLPNLIAEHAGLGRIIPEFVPHFRDPRPVAQAVERLIVDLSARQAQLSAFDHIRELYQPVRFGPDAAAQLLQLIQHHQAQK